MSNATSVRARARSPRLAQGPGQQPARPVRAVRPPGAVPVSGQGRCPATRAAPKRGSPAAPAIAPDLARLIAAHTPGTSPGRRHELPGHLPRAGLPRLRLRRHHAPKAIDTGDGLSDTAHICTPQP